MRRREGAEDALKYSTITWLNKKVRKRSLTPSVIKSHDRIGKEIQTGKWYALTLVPLLSFDE